MRKKAYF